MGYGHVIIKYGMSFLTLIYGPSIKPAGHESKKKEGSVFYSVDQENKVNETFIISFRDVNQFSQVIL